MGTKGVFQFEILINVVLFLLITYVMGLYTAIIKKTNLDVKCFKNQLPFLSKQVERVVASRLSKHTAQCNLSEPFQSAYKANLSCETALQKAQNDFLRAMDNQKVGVLILLNLSAEFDTANHIVYY